MDYPLRLSSQLKPHLKALRQQRGLTQAELGRRLGLSQVRIAEIEANPGVVSVDQLLRIIGELGGLLVVREAAPAQAPAPVAPAPRAGRGSRARPDAGKGSW